MWLSWIRICLQCGRSRFNPWIGKIPWKRERLPTPVFWPREFLDSIVHAVAKSQTRLRDFHFTSSDQSIGASALTSVLPLNIQGWSPLGLTGLISLLSRELSRVFSSTTIGKHQFFGAQPSLWSNCHIHTWLPENHSFDSMNLCQQNDVFAFYYAV